VDSTMMKRLRVEHSVSLSTFRKNPARCFQSTPVVVLSDERPLGYLIDNELFEAMLASMALSNDPAVLKRQFGLSDAWLRKVQSDDA